MNSHELLFSFRRLPNMVYSTHTPTLNAIKWAERITIFNQQQIPVRNRANTMGPMNEWIAAGRECVKSTRASRSMSTNVRCKFQAEREREKERGGGGSSTNIWWQVKNFHICDNFKFIKDMQSWIQVFRARWQSKSNEPNCSARQSQLGGMGMRMVHMVVETIATKTKTKQQMASSTKSSRFQGHMPFTYSRPCEYLDIYSNRFYCSRKSLRVLKTKLKVEPEPEPEPKPEPGALITTSQYLLAYPQHLFLAGILAGKFIFAFRNLESIIIVEMS